MSPPERPAGSGGPGGTASDRRPHPLLVATAATLLVTLASYALPEDYKALGVAVAFLGFVYALIIRGDDAARIRHHGVSLGGVAEAEPLDVRRIARDLATALGWALAAALVSFPLFWLGFLRWYHVEGGFALPAAGTVAGDLAGQLIVIALPEEAFYRGYLQTTLDDRWGKPTRILGAPLGAGVLVTAAFFALGHLATDFHPTRLAVFFPALAFGWLRARTGGVGASVAFHALCNLFASFLLRGYGLAS